MLYIAFAEACSTCDECVGAVFDHEPTGEELEKLKQVIGGMYCIRTHTVPVEINVIPESGWSWEE